MDKKNLFFIFFVAIFIPTEERTVNNRVINDEYKQSEGYSLFSRDAVESPPQDSDIKSSYLDANIFGSRSLPLRDSVEKIPDAKEFTRRLPLRDAVEKRVFDNSYLISHKKQSYDKFSQLKDSLLPQVTVYSPYIQFSKLMTDIQQVPVYRVDNPNQELLISSNVPQYLPITNQIKQDSLFNPSKKVVCYFESGAAYRKDPFSFTPQNLDPFACTHVVYVSATIHSKSYKVIPKDVEYDIVQGGFKSTIALKKINPDLKIFIAIGEKNGNTEVLFENMVANPNLRQIFTRSLVEFLTDHQFDGVDFHWRFPETTDGTVQYNVKEYFGSLLEELYDMFNSNGWLLSVSAPPSRYQLEGLNLDILAKTVDFVNVEAFDFHRYKEPVADHHAPFNSRPHDNGNYEFYNFDYAAHYWLRHGFPRSKLVMGIPSFGRTFTLQNSNQSEEGAKIKSVGRKGEYTQTPGFLAYFEICDLILQKNLRKRTDAIGSPYIVNKDQWIGFDDPESIEKKVLYIREMNLGGASLWSVDLDDYKGLCGEKWPLLYSINILLRESESSSLSDEIIQRPFQICKNEGILSNTENCALYFECRNSVAYEKICQDGYLFNTNSGRCDSKDSNNCKPGVQVYFSKEKLSDKESLKATNPEKPKVVCYVTSWAFYRKDDGKFVPENINSDLCTHVVYAFATLDPGKLLIKEFDPWTDLDNGMYKRITSIPGVIPLIGLGGWTDSAGDKYSRLVGDGSYRKKFVIGAISFLRKHDFKGIHFDWNYPVCWQSNCKKGPSSDRPNFSKLMQELKREFDKQDPPFILAATISGYKEVIDVAYDLPSLGNTLDFMSVMTYDYHGSWERKTGHVSPLYSSSEDTYPQYNTNYTMNYLVSKGAPKNKLLIGIPFYGQTFTLAKRNGNHEEGESVSGPGEPGEYTKQPGMLSYFEICSKIKHQRWTYKKDGQSGPYAYQNDQWVSFDDPDSIKTKARYIRSHGFGGAVAWTIDLDDFDNRCCQESFPLLRSINKGLGLIPDKAVSKNCNRLPAPSTPEPPKSTTGFDTSLQSSTWDSNDHSHHNHQSTSKKPITTKKPLSTTVWWELSTEESSTEWMKPTTSRRTTTSKSTPAWWSSSSKPTKVTTKKPKTTTQATDEITPTPAIVLQDNDDSENKPEKCYSGQYKSDLYNCNAYYRCIQGVFKKQYCAGGLHWNNKRKVCDWPSVAKCKVNNESQKPEWDGWSTTTRRTTHKTTKRPSTSWWQPSMKPTTTKIKCESGVYYPHELCDSFYVCVNGMLVSQKCGPGLYWNSDQSRCDWRFRVACNNGETVHEIGHKYTKIPPAAAHSPSSSCSPGTYSALKGSCEKYLYCLWGKYELFSCASGLHWNREKNICDWPNNADCTETISEPDFDDIDEITPTTTRKPIIKPSTTSKPTTKKPSWEWKPESTTENQWDWKPTKPTYTTTTAEPPAVPFQPLSGYYKIVCYFTNWAWYRTGLGKYVPEDINPDLCTHIVYGFAVLDSERLVIKAHDSWADFDNYFYERVLEYKKLGKKVTIAIGGWNDSLGDKYSRLVNNPSARARFISHIIDFIEKYGFDGLDLDWEYPKCWQVDCKKGPDSDKPAFAAFVKELKEAFEPKGLLLSAAVSPSKTVIDAGYDVPVIAKYLDWIAVMTYDFHGQWDKQTGHVAPMYVHPDDESVFFNANFSINYWITKGAPRRKIVMGMPLYGQSFQLEKADNHGLNARAPGPGQAGEFTRAAGFLAYYEICHKVKNEGWTVVQDPKRRMGPYAYKGNQWVSYDDQEQIRLKSEYIRKMDLGGGMIWALDLDDFRNRCGEGRHPLLATIRRVLATPGNNEVEIPEEATPEIPEPEEPEEPESPEQPEEVDVDNPNITEMPGSSTSRPLADPDSKYKVVCYFTNWAWYRQGVGKYLPSDIDPDLCTHIVYGFAVLNGDQLVIKPHDSWADYDNKFYEKVTAYKKKGIKVLVAIGGWNDSAGNKYSRLVNDKKARRRFIEHVMRFIEENNFDGLDLDWEYPKCWQVDCKKGPSSDKPAFAEFVRELKEAFAPKKWLLSAAVSPSKTVIDAGYDVPTLSRYLDWIAVMCYDYHGQWDKITGHVAPMYAHEEDADETFNTNFTIHYWIKKGADKKKLVLGMPMYGQSFSLADNSQHGLNAPTYGGGEAGEETRARGFLAYYEICSNIMKRGWKVEKDSLGRIGPYAYSKDQWVSFDDIDMIQYKSEYIKKMGLGGGMIWALDLDDFKNICGCEKYPLLKTINRVLRGYPQSLKKCSLSTSGESPYNPETTESPYNDKNDVDDLPCDGSQIFVAHPDKCNQYYLCNQGSYQLQTCPSGLYWNKKNCDWPQNSKCLSKKDAYNKQSSEFSLIPYEIKSDTTKDQYKVICFFTNWASSRDDIGKFTPDDIDASLCTHVVYAFAKLNPNFTIEPQNTWTDINNDYYKKIVALKSRGIKVLISLGGWKDSKSNKYSSLVNNPNARKLFVNSVIRFLNKWKFDGLDLYWMYPKCWQANCQRGSDSDKEGFSKLIEELSSEFIPRKLLLTAAVSSVKTIIDSGYDIQKLNKYLDWMSVMDYDFHGYWENKTGHIAPLYHYPGDQFNYLNTNFSLQYWIQKGASPNKLIMGLPLYGQSFTLANSRSNGLNAKTIGPGKAGEFTKSRGFLSFYEICDRVKKSGWKVIRDPAGRIGPYATKGDQWVSYDDIKDVRRKSEFLKKMNLGGGMIWALDLDDFRNYCGCGNSPLLKTINNVLRGFPVNDSLENCT